MPYKDREKQRRYWREWYRRHPEKAKAFYRQKAARRRREIKQWYHEHKSTLSCSRCSEDHKDCLEFHHPDPSQKKLDPAQMVGQSYSIKRIKTEMKKCVVLCANCHRKEHANLREI
jgi:hypothetical protein